MSPTEYHLKLAIWHWCAASPDQYVPDSLFRDIWGGKISQIPYEPEGIRRLFVALMQDPYFANCTAAHNLRPGEFLKGGDLQTVKQLFIRLLNCGTTPVNFNSQGELDAENILPVSSASGTSTKRKGTKTKRVRN
jgi:hypothetical protein